LGFPLSHKQKSKFFKAVDYQSLDSGVHIITIMLMSNPSADKYFFDKYTTVNVFTM